MKKRRGVLIGAAIGVVLGIAAVVLRVPGAVVWGFVALCGAWLLHCRRARRRAPDAFRAYAAKHFDAAGGPPPGAASVDEPVVTRWFATADPELLADDFRYVAPGRERSRARYLRAVRLGSSWLPDTLRLEEVVADPDAADVVWVRQTSTIRPPRGGPEIRTGVWHRWTLTPDRRRIRRFELIAFVEPLVHA